MDGRESRGPPPPADLLVCFPSRTRLTLIPKRICSPARPPEPAKRHHLHHLRKPSRGAGGQASSPTLWAKTKPMGSDISEPTSPRVTCAGQIKIKPKAGSCKNWQSVMEEIERLHSNKHKKKGNWAEALGFKKDVMQFLTCLRRIKFDFRCFGSFSASDYTSDEEEDDDEEDDCDKDQVGIDGNEETKNSRTVFSKWFMVLQEEQQQSKLNKEQGKEIEKSHVEEPIVAECAPPPNALLLMRCRSAPAKSWMEERDEEEEEEREDVDEEKAEKAENKTEAVAQEEKRRRNSLEVLMKYDTDFYKLSSDIAKETWVVAGDFRDPLSRSRSWKR